MRFFIDTANIEEIKEANDLGVICGVTTNPSLIAKEGRDFIQVVKEITEIVDGPISAEVISLDHEGMVKEAEKLSQIHKNIVIKLPMTVEGLKATKILSSRGIKTNVTLIFSSTQALLAARAGATYVSPFVGRLDDIGQNGLDLIEEIVDIFKVNNSLNIAFLFDFDIFICISRINTFNDLLKIFRMVLFYILTNSTFLFTGFTTVSSVIFYCT